MLSVCGALEELPSLRSSQVPKLSLAWISRKGEHEWQSQENTSAERRQGEASAKDNALGESNSTSHRAAEQERGGNCLDQRLLLSPL